MYNYKLWLNSAHIDDADLHWSSIGAFKGRNDLLAWYAVI